jgi:hypothetical protein
MSQSTFYSHTKLWEKYNALNKLILRVLESGTGDIVVGIEKKKNLRGLSPKANKTDPATAVCRRSDCQLFADRGCHVVSVTDPFGRILGFLDRSRYLSIK